MLFGHYTFHCRFKTEAVLPPYKGSTVRGLLGHALKRVVCALKHQECPTCLLHQDCLYARMFGLPPPADKAAANASAEPHAFVLEPPLEEKTHYQPGDCIAIGLILFGEINRKLPYFVYAFDEMGRIGMGRRIEGRRGRFALEAVRWNNGAVYEKDKGRIHVPDPLPRLSLDSVPSDMRVDTIDVTLVTPLRFKRNGRLSDDLSFEQLVRLSLRRASNLLSTYGDGEPDLDYRGLVERASAVQTVSADLAWVDIERYSNRQENRIGMGGIVGNLSWVGELAPFYPAIAFGAKTHLGKNSSFGYGQVLLAAA